MKGYPKHLNSKADYLYIKEECEPAYWKPLWQNLLDNRFIWAATDLLNKAEKCIVDDTHRYEKIMPVKAEDPIMYQQYELKLNPNCDMVKYGFTVEEIEAALAEK